MGQQMRASVSNFYRVRWPPGLPGWPRRASSLQNRTRGFSRGHRGPATTDCRNRWMGGGPYAPGIMISARALMRGRWRSDGALEELGAPASGGALIKSRAAGGARRPRPGKRAGARYRAPSAGRRQSHSSGTAGCTSAPATSWPS